MGVRGSHRHEDHIQSRTFPARPDWVLPCFVPKGLSTRKPPFSSSSITFSTLRRLGGTDSVHLKRLGDWYRLFVIITVFVLDHFVRVCCGLGDLLRDGWVANGKVLMQFEISHTWHIQEVQHLPTEMTLPKSVDWVP